MEGVLPSGCTGRSRVPIEGPLEGDVLALGGERPAAHRGRACPPAQTGSPARALLWADVCDRLFIRWGLE